VKKAIFILLLSLNVFAQELELNSMAQIAQRCDLKQNTQPLYSNDFSWGYDLLDLISKFYEIYFSNKRLPLKAYWDKSEKKLLLPIREGWGAPVEINETFVQSISRHIERAFELKVIEGVFFPDMGHSHLLIPEQHYNTNYKHFEVSEFSKVYKNFFKDPQIKVLYHTAEQLKMLDEANQVIPNPQVQFRHKTRNIVGELHPDSDLTFIYNSESPANTAGAPTGYVWWGGGFNLSANQDGCFAYKKNGRVFYFDISLFDLEYDPNQNVVYSNF